MVCSGTPYFFSKHFRRPIFNFAAKPKNISSIRTIRLIKYFKEATMKKMPVLFVGHVSPMNVLNKENPFNTHYFYDLGKILSG